MTLATVRSPRRIAIAAIAVALLGATALLAVSAPPAAAATYGRCDPGDFCLHRDTTMRGAIYQFGGSDSNLNTDRFEVAYRNEQSATTRTRSGTERSRAAKEYVVIYDRAGHRGFDACVLPGDRGQLPRFWWKNVESYKWVTPGACFNACVINSPTPLVPASGLVAQLSDEFRADRRFLQRPWLTARHISLLRCGCC